MLLVLEILHLSMGWTEIFTAIFLIEVVLGNQQVPCTQKLTFGDDSFVCVCNSTGCDSFGQVSLPQIGQYHHVVSSRDEFRFNQRTGSKTTDGTLSANTTILIDETNIRQQMFGFGGAFTDAAGLNIATLSEDLQAQIISGYFSPDGLEYNIGRIPIAGCDFSTRPYSYDDVEGDVDLVHFNLTMEDHEYKIPYIKQAIAMSSKNLLLFGSPWSPPSWMKSNGMFNGTGNLLPQYRQSWANYFVKFLEAYEEEGIRLWGLTAQNEPTVGYLDWQWNACGFTAAEQRDYIRDYLGPTLNTCGFGHLKLMTADDSREVFPWYPTTVLEDEEASQFIAGVAVHWYADSYTLPSVVSTVHDRFPDKFILYTEACTGEFPAVHPVRLGSWERGESYALDIVENLNHWSTGWVDWNLALDMQGAPNWAANFVDSPIIVNKEKNEFYRQPMFYAMGHFSKFITEGHFSVKSTVNEEGGRKGKVVATAVTDSSMQYITIVAVSTKEDDELVTISDSSGNKFDVLLPAKSINTIVYDKRLA